MSRSFGLRRGEQWLPSSLDVEGKEIQLLNWEQIEQLSARTLLIKSRNIQSKLGAERLPPLVPGTAEVLIKWLMTVQCALCSQVGAHPCLDHETQRAPPLIPVPDMAQPTPQITGMKVTPKDFGTPEEFADELIQPADQSQQQFGDMHGMIDHNSGVGAKACFAGA
jgi:hypothetical protein